MKQKIKATVGVIVGIIYAPFYVFFVLLHFVARLLLAISYIGVFEKRMGIDIFESLFRYDRRKY